jgi:hypothetical protein
MANLENIKDIRTIASVSALVGVGIFSAYFNNELDKIKKEQDVIKDHLASTIPFVQPGNQQKIDCAFTNIKTLDDRMAKTQDEIQTLMKECTKRVDKIDTSRRPKQPPVRRPYKRVTDRDRSNETKPKFAIKQPKIYNQNEDSDIDDDIAIMKG